MTAGTAVEAELLARMSALDARDDRVGRATCTRAGATQDSRSYCSHDDACSP